MCVFNGRMLYKGGGQIGRVYFYIRWLMFRQLYRSKVGQWGWYVGIRG